MDPFYVSEPEYKSDASSESDRFSDPGTEFQLIIEESLPEPAESLPDHVIEEPKPVSVPDIELNPASFNTPVTYYNKPLPVPDDEWRKRMRMCVCNII